MLDANKLRRVEARNAYGDWVRLKCIGQLEPGDVFRMFEPNGSPVRGGDGETQFIVSGPASIPVGASTAKAA